MIESSLLNGAFDAVTSAIVVVKFSIKQAHVVHVNPAFEKLTGYGIGSIKDKDIINLLFTNTVNVPADLDKLRQDFLKKKKAEHTLKYKNKDMVTFTGKLKIAPIKSIKDANLFVATLEDVSNLSIMQKQLDESKNKQQLLTAKLDQLSKIDSLTGVYNPKAINHELSILFNSAKRNYGSFSMLFIEIDKLKEIEEKHSERIAKKCIESFATGLTRNFRRRSDIIIRYSHNQFLVCFAGANDAQTFNLADKIVHSVNNTPVLIDENTKLNLSVSVGMLSVVLNLDSNLDHTIGMAHLAVDKAKKQGGNQIYTAKTDSI